MVWFFSLLVLCYAPVLWRLVNQWNNDDDMGHGFFVPVIAGYIDARRERLAAAGIDVDERIAHAADCPHGVRIMANFRRHFVDKG